MYVLELAKTYEAKTDEELLQLAAEPTALTPEAQIVLRSEMARRKINIPIASGQIDTISVRKAAAPRASSTGVAGFMSQTIGLYKSHFWLFFGLIAPAVAIGYVAVLLCRNHADKIVRYLPRGIAVTSHRAELVEMGLVNLAGFLVSWIAFSLSFSAITVAVQRLLTENLVPSWRECLAPVSHRLGSFLRLSSLIFLLLLVAEAAALLVLQFLIYWILWRVLTDVPRIMVQLTTLISFGLGLLAISRFSLAIPSLVLDGREVGESLLLSYEYTKRKSLVLASLLAKCLVGGYVAAMLPFWLASYILGSAFLYWWLPWILSAASVVTTSFVEPTMFIGFALLYLQRSKSLPSSISGMVAADIQG